MQDTKPTDEEQPSTEPPSDDQVQTALDAATAEFTKPFAITCGYCGRQRTLADDYDYTPLQLFTGRPLGWFNGDGEQMCGECLGKSMRGVIP